MTSMAIMCWKITKKKAISLLENTYVLFGFTSELIFFEHITFKNWF